MRVFPYRCGLWTHGVLMALVLLVATAMSAAGEEGGAGLSGQADDGSIWAVGADGSRDPQEEGTKAAAAGL